MLLSDYINDVQEIVHDSTASSWPLSRVISRINDARLDAARDMHCVRQNVTGIQLLPGVEIYGLNGAVVGATVTSGGSNYGPGATVPVTFAAPPAGGTRALGFGNLVGGSLVSITLTQWGQGYNAVPAITVGGIGAGAAATAVPLFQANPLSTTIGNPLNIVGISYIWNNARQSLRYQNFTLFQAYFRAFPQNSFTGPPDVWSHHQQGQQAYIQRPPDQLYLSEWDVIFMPSPLVANTDSDTQLVDPWARAVQWKAASYLLEKHQNVGLASAREARYEALVPRIITTSGGIRIPNPYHRTFQRRVTGMGG
jgi:hypothetical protein